MADNIEAASGSGGPPFGTAELSWSGDTIHMPGSFQGLLSGSEGAWTFSLLVGGAGAVAAGVQRVTLASDDPAVALLTTMDADTSALAAADLMLGTDFSNVFGTASLVLATQADDVANTSDGLQTTSFAYMFDGTTWDRMRGTSTNGLLVDLGANNDVTVTGTVSLAAAIPAGTNNIGDVDVLSLPALPAGTNNIGDVDVLSVVPGTGATALGKAVDSAAGGTDTGVAILAIRDDALTTLTPVDGDYVPLRVSSTGALHVTGSSGATEYTEDAAAAANPVGGVVILVRADTPGAVATTDGDNVAQRGTNYGAAYTTLLKADGTEAVYIDAAVDDASTGTDAGIPILAIRDDSLSALTPVEGDFVALRVNSTGALHVTGGGGGTQYAVDDVAGGTNTGTLTLVVRDDALTTLTPADADYTQLRVTSVGRLWVSAVLDTAIPAGTNNIGDVDIASIAAGDNNIGNVDIVTMPNVTLAAGTNTNEVVGDAAHDAAAAGNPVLIGAYASAAAPSDVSADADVVRLWSLRNGSPVVNLAVGGTLVTGSAGLPTAQQGTWNINNVSGTVSLPTGAATSANQSTEITSLQLLDNIVVAHDAAISGSTGVAIIGLNARSSEPTAVASADATQALATLLGKQVVLPYAIPASTWQYASAAAVTDTADDEAKAAGSAGVRNYITGIQVFNGHDTVGTEVVIKDGSTVIWRGWAEQTGGGCSAVFNPPLRGTAATAVNVANITTGSATYFNLQGFVAAE